MIGLLVQLVNLLQHLLLGDESVVDARLQLLVHGLFGLRQPEQNLRVLCRCALVVFEVKMVLALRKCAEYLIDILAT